MIYSSGTSNTNMSVYHAFYIYVTSVVVWNVNAVNKITEVIEVVY